MPKICLQFFFKKCTKRTGEYLPNCRHIVPSYIIIFIFFFSFSIVLLVGRIEETLKNYEYTQCDLGSNQELALDRLGQFLHCLSATGSIHGKLYEVFNSVKRIQQKNRLLQMYLNRGQ